eukprot:CAMPEP_0119304178 /NCGR_PEP_ID=MMETSP1333-20130426/5471_1 /TAXON_ID=418940 /ORGANISM="Scyphosphaera apsteinii, Strain RCC1455" /LENGTH=755 /DNA_ID=CAMNT_0007307023 /DNA_START=247 /DNA_END=2514 /DNA_ORIENTATION=+
MVQIDASLQFLTSLCSRAELVEANQQFVWLPLPIVPSQLPAVPSQALPLPVVPSQAHGQQQYRQRTDSQGRSTRARANSTSLDIDAAGERAESELATDELLNTMQQLDFISESPVHKGLRASMGHIQPNGTGSVVGLHFSLKTGNMERSKLIQSAQESEVLDVVFKPEKLMYWSTLSEWHPAQGKRVYRSVQHMLAKPSFRKLHVLAYGSEHEEVEVGLYVLVGSLHVRSANGSICQSGMHLTLAARWVQSAKLDKTSDTGSTNVDLPGDHALPDDSVELIIKVLRELVEASCASYRRQARPVDDQATLLSLKTAGQMALASNRILRRFDNLDKARAFSSQRGDLFDAGRTVLRVCSLSESASKYTRPRPLQRQNSTRFAPAWSRESTPLVGRPVTADDAISCVINNFLDAEEAEARAGSPIRIGLTCRVRKEGGQIRAGNSEHNHLKSDERLMLVPEFESLLRSRLSSVATSRSTFLQRPRSKYLVSKQSSCCRHECNKLVAPPPPPATLARPSPPPRSSSDPGILRGKMIASRSLPVMQSAADSGLHVDHRAERRWAFHRSANGRLPTLFSFTSVAMACVFLMKLARRAAFVSYVQAETFETQAMQQAHTARRVRPAQMVRQQRAQHVAQGKGELMVHKPIAMRTSHSNATILQQRTKGKGDHKGVPMRTSPSNITKEQQHHQRAPRPGRPMSPVSQRPESPVHEMNRKQVLNIEALRARDRVSVLMKQTFRRSRGIEDETLRLFICESESDV